MTGSGIPAGARLSGRARVALDECGGFDMQLSGRVCSGPGKRYVREISSQGKTKKRHLE